MPCRQTRDGLRAVVKDQPIEPAQVEHYLQEKFASHLEPVRREMLRLARSYPPEENPIERLWLWIKDHYFSNRIYRDYETLLEEVCRMWNRLDSARIQSVCRSAWIKHAN